jgi:hypothetical protein
MHSTPNMPATHWLITLSGVRAFRKRILTGKIAAFVEQAIRRICDINTWTSLRAQCAGRSCASLSQRFPDRCSLTDCSHPERHHRPRVFQHFPARQETALGWCPSRSRSYYVGSVGDMSRASVVTYIQLGQDGSRDRQKMEIPLALPLTGFTTPQKVLVI